MRHKRLATLLTLAQLGYAHWLFGNVYEAVVGVPERLARDDQGLPSLLGAGSPVRYYLPGVPTIVGATLAALVTGWPSRDARPWLCAATGCAATGLVATAYLVGAVNRHLFLAGNTTTPADRQRLLRTWYRLNALRIVAAAGAWLAAQRATGSRGV